VIDNVSGAISNIDHFFSTDDLLYRVNAYFSLHEGENFSDHSPLFLRLTLPHEQFEVERVFNRKKLSWSRATLEHKQRYSVALRGKLADIEIPIEALHCHGATCPREHSAMIAKYHDSIVNCCIEAANRTLPRLAKRGWAGWNEYAAPYKEAACFWHGIWVANGRPRNGWVSEIRNRTRREYKRVIRWLSRNQEKLRAGKMADAYTRNASRDFWAEVRNATRKKSSFPSMVDDVVGENEICDHFRSKYDDLYNSVSYDANEMENLISEMNVKCSSVCRNSMCYDSHNVSVYDVEHGVKKLKVSKADSNDSLSSDNFIFACKELYVHISMFLTMTLHHADVPGALAHSVLVPIVKNGKKSKSDGNNYRSIAISSIIGKIFDNIVLKRHCNVLKTSDLQFGFCANRSTSMCTFVLEEVTNYYSQYDAPVYIALLDASRAFDRVNFVRLFNLLLKKDFCALNAKFLITMYIAQTLCVRWCNSVSSSFNCSNGVKQGGVLSPVLFCTYMDTLLKRLASSKVGCRIGDHYVGALSYADDLTLIAPTRSAMQQMLGVCEHFAAEYDVLFNGSKSVSLVINSRLGENAPSLTLNGQPIPRLDNAVHLGHHIGKNSHSMNVQKAIGDINCRVNSLLCNFKFCTFSSLCMLFQSFCSSFYGSPLWKLNDIERLSVCWRKNLRRLFRLPPRTHSIYIPLIIQKPDLQTQLLGRFSKFFSKCYNNENVIISFCSKMSLTSTSIVNSNITSLRFCTNNIMSLYDIVNFSASSTLNSCWFDNVDVIHKERSDLILELMLIRDGVLNSPLERHEIELMLIDLCTD